MIGTHDDLITIFKYSLRLLKTFKNAPKNLENLLRFNKTLLNLSKSLENLLQFNKSLLDLFKLTKIRKDLLTISETLSQLFKIHSCLFEIWYNHVNFQIFQFNFSFPEGHLPSLSSSYLRTQRGKDRIYIHPYWFLLTNFQFSKRFIW